ncbi:hypothetical protein FB451DRAFT_1179640 [Mycena latifolia]|nr:hypothetical protein FB451DRAFT_1179640 [Mycena latifolia]
MRRLPPALRTLAVTAWGSGPPPSPRLEIRRMSVAPQTDTKGEDKQHPSSSCNLLKIKRKSSSMMCLWRQGPGQLRAVPGSCQGVSGHRFPTFCKDCFPPDDHAASQRAARSPLTVSAVVSDDLPEIFTVEIHGKFDAKQETRVQRPTLNIESRFGRVVATPHPRGECQPLTYLNGPACACQVGTATVSTSAAATKRHSGNWSCPAKHHGRSAAMRH